MAVLRKLADRISDQLSGPVKGDITTALDLDDGNLSGVKDILEGVSSSSEGIDRLVLHEQQSVPDVARDTVSQGLLHSLMGFGIGQPSQPLNPQSTGHSPQPPVQSARRRVWTRM